MGNYIKSVVPNGNYNSGVYKLVNKDKYLNVKEIIIYRSSYELIFCKICDTSPTVIKWQSEPFGIQYFDPVKQTQRTYYPDFLVITENTNNSLDKVIIEVKPLNFLTKPVYPKKVNHKSIKSYNFKLSVFITNMAKYKAAKAFCEKRNMRYSFLTEAFFNKYKSN